MPIEELFSQLLTINIWFFAKIIVLAVLTLYLVFAFLVIKEVALMNKTLLGVGNLVIKIIAWLHLVIAVFIFILAFLIL